MSGFDEVTRCQCGAQMIAGACSVLGCFRDPRTMWSGRERPSTRTTCARCSWPLKVEGLSDEDADRVEALHRQRCPDPVCDRDSVLHEREPGGDLYFGGIKVTSGPMVSGRNRKLSKEGQETYDRLRAECGLVRPDGFAQSTVNAAKAVLLSKVERKR